MEDLASRVATPGVVMTDAIDMNTLNAPVLEEITDRQDAVEVRRRRGSR
jgi:hypothetical protein